MDFSALPPEIISGQMYSGPGSGTMVAAVSAWDSLAAELHSAATAYRSAITELTESWQGPGSARMAAATTPFLTWLTATATQASQAATQAGAAVNAFETAFAGTVPPPVIAANRSQLASLLATNVLGQNTAAIAALEAQYAQMWLQDATMMATYAASSEAASKTTPFTAPPRSTNPAGAGAQPAALANSAGTAAARSAESGAAGLLGTSSPSVLYEDLFLSVANVSKFSTIANFSMGGPNLGMAQFKTFHKPAVVNVPVPPSALGAGLRAGPPAMAAGLAGTVTAGAADANLVGRLSVPPSWASNWGKATKVIQLATQATPGTGLAAAQASGVPAGSVAPMALGSLAGGAAGGVAPRVLNATGGRGRTGLANAGKAPVKLDRVIAQLQHRPDAVRHWNTDQAGLDDLIAELSKKPGVHAVHLAAPHSGKKVTP